MPALICTMIYVIVTCSIWARGLAMCSVPSHDLYHTTSSCEARVHVRQMNGNMTSLMWHFSFSNLSASGAMEGTGFSTNIWVSRLFDYNVVHHLRWAFTCVQPTQDFDGMVPSSLAEPLLETPLLSRGGNSKVDWAVRAVSYPIHIVTCRTISVYKIQTTKHSGTSWP